LFLTISSLHHYSGNFFIRSQSQNIISISLASVLAMVVVQSQLISNLLALSLCMGGSSRLRHFNQEAQLCSNKKYPSPLSLSFSFYKVKAITSSQLPA
jgi:hypothetical protein